MKNPYSRHYIISFFSMFLLLTGCYENTYDEASAWNQINSANNNSSASNNNTNDSVPNIYHSKCPTTGSYCAEDAMGCCENNTIWQCKNNQYASAKCSDIYNSEYYCDEQAAANYADCVKPCSASDDGKIKGWSNCNDNRMELYICEKGDSGYYGNFGGYSINALCSDDKTHAISCENIANNQAPTEISCPSMCTTTSINQYTFIGLCL
ncbi:MAG: hypothetical protein IIY06_00495 [Proteobacteria bacterium]|nr:hypothetical protein [Pseudomonadota bacterium]